MKQLISLFVLCGLVGCGNQIGDTASNDDISTNIITTISSGSDNAEACPDSFLWKPISESDGNLAVLFPTGYFFQEVFAQWVDEDGNDREDKGEDVGLTNGGRQTFRFPKEGGEYTGILTADDCTFEVVDPSERTE